MTFKRSPNDLKPIEMLITKGFIKILVNKQNTGTQAIVLDEVALGRSRYTPTDDQTALKDEIKRVPVTGGENVGEGVISISSMDTSTDAYKVGEIGVYAKKPDGTKVLAYVFSEPANPNGDNWIFEKSAKSDFLFNTDIQHVDVDCKSVTVTGDFYFGVATHTRAGVLELSTDAEAKARSSDKHAITPKSLKAAMDHVFNLMFPVGHVLITTNSANPSTYGYSGTWTAIDSETGLNATSKDSSTLGKVSGDNTPIVPVPKHDHIGDASSSGSHDHQLIASTNSTGHHSHSLSGRTNTTGNHYHGGGYKVATRGSNSGSALRVQPDPVHTSTAGNHSHSVSGTANATGSHKHTISGVAGPAGDHTHPVTVKSSGIENAKLNVQGKHIDVMMWKRVS